MIGVKNESPLSLTIAVPCGGDAPVVRAPERVGRAGARAAVKLVLIGIVAAIVVA